MNSFDFIHKRFIQTIMCKSLSILFFILILHSAKAQKILLQNIKGQITEAATGLPLIGANVYILDSDPVIGTSTDQDGYYKFKNVPVGRYRLAFSSIGYKSATTGSLLLTTGKEFVQDITLEEDLYTIDVEITAITDQDVQSSELGTISIQKFNSELSSRYAGSRNDVARMAAGFAGVSANDDSRNDIIIRGNSPSGLLWRMNGVDIPNPSHFGALGATGGPVSILNNNLLSNSTFMTGAFPAIYGNALSGVFDLTMRKGNRDKIEGLFAVSFNGFEAGLEGPIGKNGGSYLVNYRYSVVDLVSKLGGNSAGTTGTGEAIPRYQDLSFNVNLPTKKFGAFNLFGLWGNSGIDFLSEIQDSENPNLFTDSNENLYYKSDMQVYALNNKHYFNNRSFGKLTLSYSRSGANTVVDTISNELLITPQYRDDSSQDRLTLAYQYKNKITSKHSLILGTTINNLTFNFLDSVRTNDQSFRTIRDFQGNSLLSQAYGQWQYKFNDELTVNYGLYAQHFSFNSSFAIEPRLNFKYEVNPRFSVSLGIGRHSKLQDYQLYLVRTKLSDGTYIETNTDLGMTKNRQAVVGLNWNFLKNWRLKSEFYYQRLSDVPVEKGSSSFSAVNLGAEFEVPSQDSLINEGKGRNKGVEFTLERDFDNGFYLLSTLSIFKSTYKGSDGISRSTAFDNRYVANILAGKEVKLNNQFSLSVDTKITIAGGRRYTPIDLAESIREGEAILVKNSAYSRQFDDYFRTDLKATIRWNMKRLSHYWSLDLQNLFDTQNAFGESFDVRNSRVEANNQLGRYPVVEYKLLF